MLQEQRTLYLKSTPEECVRFYLSSIPKEAYSTYLDKFSNEAKFCYFVKGEQKLQEACPTFFPNEDEAIKAANEMGWAVK